MKPNLKTKQQLVKTTFNGQQKPVVPKKVSQKPTVLQQQQFEPLGESIVGERQFIYFDNNNSGIKNNSSMQGALDENVSIVGTMQKVYFANASSVNKEELQKNKQLQEQSNAFKPSQKIIHEPVQNFNKKPKFTSVNPKFTPLNQTSQTPEQQDENQFLELTTVGKWNKNNKSTVISEQMKKMHNHLENRLTQTKWAKKKPSHVEQTSKTEKNSSMAKNESTQINTSANNSQVDKNMHNNSMKVVHTVKPTTANQLNSSGKQHPATQHSIHVKKGAQKYMEGMSEQAKQKMSSMTSWKEQEKPEEEEVEDQAEDAEQEEEQQEEQQQEESEQEEESEQQEEQEEQGGDSEGQGDEEQSSGDQGWDEPDQQQPQQQQPQQQQQVNQDPFTVPQPQPVPEVKAKKWSSKLDTNSKVTNSNKMNPSIVIEGTINKQQEQAHNVQQGDNGEQDHHEEQQLHDDQIEDLTEGEIPNEEVDPQWEKIQQILLRIQKLVN